MVAINGHDAAEVLEGNPNDPDSQGAVTFIGKLIAIRPDDVYNTARRRSHVSSRRGRRSPHGIGLPLFSVTGR